MSCSKGSDTDTNTSGENIIYQYYRSFPGTEVDFQVAKVRNLKSQNELLVKSRNIQNKLKYLNNDCPETCASEIETLRSTWTDYTKSGIKMTEELVQIQIQQISQNVIMLGIHKSVEHSCRRSDRVNLYDQFFNQAFTSSDAGTKKELDFHGVESLFNTVYNDTNKDLMSGEFIVDCSWENLDVFKDTVIKKMELMKLSKIQKENKSNK